MQEGKLVMSSIWIVVVLIHCYSLSRFPKYITRQKIIPIMVQREFKTAEITSC